MAATQPIIDRVDIGWYYTLMAAINLICCAGYWVEGKLGMRWRLGKAKAAAITATAHKLT